MSGLITPCRAKTRIERRCSCCNDRIAPHVYYCRFDIRRSGSITKYYVCDWCQVSIRTMRLSGRYKVGGIIQRIETHDLPKGKTVKFNKGNIGVVKCLYYNHENKLTAQVEVGDTSMDVPVFESAMRFL